MHSVQDRGHYSSLLLCIKANSDGEFPEATLEVTQKPYLTQHMCTNNVAIKCLLDSSYLDGDMNQLKAIRTGP